MTPSNIFGGLNFASIAHDPDFKEDSVREEICLPILKRLGYKRENIIRSKNLLIQFGRKKRESGTPDYILSIDQHNAFVLEAKAPNQVITEGKNVEQAFSYAMHNEVRSKYFALCNGLEFTLFRTDRNRTHILTLRLDEIESRWNELARYLSIKSFHTGYRIQYHRRTKAFDYVNKPLPEEITVQKQKSLRHYGVHGYFTRQSWDIVQAYIENFTRRGDIVLDPFGGSGVTAVEALMIGRKAIHIDINPMANFIVESLIAPVDIQDLKDAFETVKKKYIANEPKTAEDYDRILKTLPGPRPLPLPADANAKTADQLFSHKQAAQLALLKSIILRQKNENIRQSLMLMFSGLVSKINLTYHQSSNRTGGRGNASAFQYYRYRIAPLPVDLDVTTYFMSRCKHVLKAKADIQNVINSKTITNLTIKKGTATNLSFLQDESVDYIYTDPPYGKKIPYLDLSTMWNAWLDLDVTEEDYALEAIEGGEHNKTKEQYNALIAQSIREMYRVLKFDRWLTFVFAHKDPEFWHLIIDTAEQCGFEYVGAVPQKNGQTSFKKRQHPFTVLSGQLMINFRKVRNPKVVMNVNFEMEVDKLVIETIEEVIAKHYGATLEQINDYLIIQGMEKGFLDLLKKQYSDLTPLLQRAFDYDSETKKWHLKKNVKFRSNIDVNVRIEYLLRSYLNRMERENQTADTDGIILHIMPLLRNGTTPENQTILNVLEDIGERCGKDCWRLKADLPQLFR